MQTLLDPLFSFCPVGSGKPTEMLIIWLLLLLQIINCPLFPRVWYLLPVFMKPQQANLLACKYVKSQTLQSSLVVRLSRPWTYCFFCLKVFPLLLIQLIHVFQKLTRVSYSQNLSQFLIIYHFFLLNIYLLHQKEGIYFVHHCILSLAQCLTYIQLTE